MPLVGEIFLFFVMLFMEESSTNKNLEEKVGKVDEQCQAQKEPDIKDLACSQTYVHFCRLGGP